MRLHTFQRVFLLLALLPTLQAIAEPCAFLLNGGANQDSNFGRYYETLVHMRDALKHQGYSLDRMKLAYPDEGLGKVISLEEDKTKERRLSLETYHSSRYRSASRGSRDLLKPTHDAIPSSIEQALRDLEKMNPPCSQTFVLVTDHGSEQEGIHLWRGAVWKWKDAAKRLKKFSEKTGSAVQVAGTLCYGGQLLQAMQKEAPESRLCGMTTTDGSHTAFLSHRWAAEAETASHKKTPSSFESFFKSGLKAGPYWYSQSSLDVFLEKNTPAIEKLIQKKGASACVKSEQSEQICPSLKAQQPGSSWVAFFKSLSFSKRSQRESVDEDSIEDYCDFLKTRDQKVQECIAEKIATINAFAEHSALRDLVLTDYQDSTFFITACEKQSHLNRLALAVKAFAAPNSSLRKRYEAQFQCLQKRLHQPRGGGGEPFSMASQVDRKSSGGIQ